MTTFSAPDNLKNPRITFGVQLRKNAPKQALSVSSAAPRTYLLRKSHPPAHPRIEDDVDSRKCFSENFTRAAGEPLRISAAYEDKLGRVVHCC
jgi:hypothetical protein